MRWVGLTGGIGSGKSMVARLLAEHGAVIIDSDQIAREVIAPGTEGYDEVMAAFGTVDRPSLARLVFGDEQERRRLEAIIHPRVGARIAELAAAAPADAVVINDVPLLVEANLKDRYEVVIVVFADEKVRLERLIRDRGMSEEDARARIAAQATDEQRHAVADYAIVNEGTVDQLRSEVDRVWQALTNR